MSTGRRERKREKRRREMLDAAMRLVAEEGLSGLTIARLADELDAAVGALYRYFPSKDALLAGLQVQALEGFVGELEQELCRLPERVDALPLVLERQAKALVQIWAVVRAYLDDATHHPSRHLMIHAFMSAPEPFLSEDGAQAGAVVIQQILAHVQEAMRVVCDDALPKAVIAQRTHVLWATMHGLQHFRKRDRIQPAHLQTDTLCAVSFRSLFVGWGVDGALVDQAFEAFSSVTAEA